MKRDNFNRQMNNEFVDENFKLISIDVDYSVENTTATITAVKISKKSKNCFEIWIIKQISMFNEIVWDERRMNKKRKHIIIIIISISAWSQYSFFINSYEWCVSHLINSWNIVIKNSRKKTAPTRITCLFISFLFFFFLCCCLVRLHLGACFWNRMRQWCWNLNNVKLLCSIWRNRLDLLLFYQIKPISTYRFPRTIERQHTKAVPPVVPPSMPPPPPSSHLCPSKAFYSAIFIQMTKKTESIFCWIFYLHVAFPRFIALSFRTFLPPQPTARPDRTYPWYKRVLVLFIYQRLYANIMGK